MSSYSFRLLTLFSPLRISILDHKPLLRTFDDSPNGFSDAHAFFSSFTHLSCSFYPLVSMLYFSIEIPQNQGFIFVIWTKYVLYYNKYIKIKPYKWPNCGFITPYEECMEYAQIFLLLVWSRWSSFDRTRFSSWCDKQSATNLR